MEKKKIPLGTLKPYESYNGEISDQDIVTIDFDPIETPTTQRKAMNILLLGGSGDGKCNHGSVRILTSDGKYQKIKDIPDQGYLVSINQKSLRNEVKRYIKIKNNKEQHCYKIKTLFGSEIICSGNHPFMVDKGIWKKIDELNEGDFIATTRYISYFGDYQMNDNEVKILAYMIADGTNTHVEWTKKDQLIVDDFSESLKYFDCGLRLKNKKKYHYKVFMDYKRKRYEKNPIRIILEKHNIFGKKSIEKEISDKIMQLPKESLRLFLNRLFSSDGTIWRTKNRHKWRYSIQYCSGNKEMCLQIKHLLLRFGILSKFYEKKNKRFGRTYYYIEIQNAYFILKFIEEIGFFGEKAKRVEQWAENINSIKHNTNFDVVPIYKKKRYLGRERALKYDESLANSDIFWDRVKSIEDVGYHETYDLQVEDNENYIGNDFIAHNSLLIKVIWSILHKAGYYCSYIDPKSTDSGRARIKWDSPRLPKNMEPEGILLQHYMPTWAMYNYDHLKHNFIEYCTRLSKINEREMWQGLGMTTIGASKVTKIINHYQRMKGKISMHDLKNEIFNLTKEDLPSGSVDAVIRVLTDLEDYDVVRDNVPEINLLRDWKRGFSVCMSYNSASRILMTFDIGQKIKESAKYYFQGNRNPVMWFLDDSSFYAKEMPKIVPYNFAVQEIKEIGFNYRSLGIYNCMAVQSLGIIDENVAETYRIKIISPLFQSTDSLSSINIPQRAIDYLRKGVLVKDRSKHLMQFILIDEDNDVIPFFPFTPPCNHFTEIYRERDRNG